MTADRVKVTRRDEEGAQGWVTVVDEEVSFDLLEVTGIEMTLGSAELEPGVYLQIRMHVVSVEVTVDGKDLDAEVPSGIIRVVRPMAIVAGETTVAAFDFDAQKSVVVTGSDRVLFKPVIKLLVRNDIGPFRPSVSTPEAQSPPTPPSVPQATATPEPESTATATVTPPTTPAPSTEAEESKATEPETVEILVTDPPPPDIEH